MEGFQVRPLTIILLESSLELVPDQIKGHEQVKRTAERFGISVDEVILDKTYHYHAMSALPQKWKRGRPDILHVTLLVLTDTPLIEMGLLDVYFQSYDGRVFRLKPGVRVPKHYDRFKGLMAQLLRFNKVPPEAGDEALIYKAYDSLSEFVSEKGKLILLWEKGVEARISYIVARALVTGKPIGIGAFPRGDFKRSTLRKASEKYSIMGGRPLKTWSVASRIVHEAERILLGV